MTNNEIRRSYNEAKDKLLQIEILSQLTLKPKQEILAIVDGKPFDVPVQTLEHYGEEWTDEEEEILASGRTEGVKYKNIAMSLGRSVSSVRARYSKLKQKSKEVE